MIMWSRLKWGAVLGGEAFAERVRKEVRLNRETSGQRALRRRKTWEEIVSLVEQVKGEKWPEFLPRHGDWGRDLVLWAARRWGGMTLREAGERAGNLDYTAVSMAVRRLEALAEHDATLRAAMHLVQAKSET